MNNKGKNRKEDKKEKQWVEIDWRDYRTYFKNIK